MAESCKIQINHHQVRITDDLESFGRILFPDNKNQRRAFIIIFLELKWAGSLVPNLNYLTAKYGISNRILQRTRCKLRKMGIIDHVSRFSKSHDYQEGWSLSNKFADSMKFLAEEYGNLRTRKECPMGKEKDYNQLNFV